MYQVSGSSTSSSLRQKLALWKWILQLDTFHQAACVSRSRPSGAVAIRNLNIDPAIAIYNGIFESPASQIEAPDAQRKLDSHSESQIKVAG